MARNFTQPFQEPVEKLSADFLWKKFEKTGSIVDYLLFLEKSEKFTQVGFASTPTR